MNSKFDKKRYKESIRNATSFQYNYQSFGHRGGTLGYFAHKLRMRPKTLIGIFRKVGIQDLTPNHILDEAQWKILLDFYKDLSDVKSEQIYSAGQSVDNRLILVQEVNLRLLKDLSKKPELIYSLEPRQFEELVAKLLEDQGCDVSLTKRTRDGGYDIFGKMKHGLSELVFLAECKRYSSENKVGVEVIRNMYGVTEIQKANLGLIITSSSFSKDAQEEKLRIGPRIDLKDYRNLCEWLLPYKSIG